MKLLICTQKVDKNDPILGFFHRWIEEFATHYEKVTVICLYKGEYSLPKNVEVISLGKERGVPKIEYVIQFYRLIFLHRNEYKHVFVHMNPVYVVLGGLVWRLLGKKIALWYTHKSVDTKLRIAEKLVHHIFTASKESFRLPSHKVVITGHAIDVDAYASVAHEVGTTLRLTVIGRISTAKRIDVFIKTIADLNSKGIAAEGVIVGDVGAPEDVSYVEAMKSLAKELGSENQVHFVGAVTHEKIKDYLARTDIFLHTSETGSMDKSVLEALACGVPVLSSSEAFKGILIQNDSFLNSKDSTVIADQVLAFVHRIPEEKEKNKTRMKEYVFATHSLRHTMKKIVGVLSGATAH